MSIAVFHDTAERGDVKVFPMFFTQQGFWFLDQLEPESVAYNMPVAIRLRRLLDVEMLKRSLAGHEALHTTFWMMEGQPTQVMVPTLTIRCPWSTSKAILRQSGRLRRCGWRQRKCSTPLISPRAARAGHLIAIGRGEIVLLTLRHIVSDGWFLDVFFHELVTRYEAFSTG